ncbi:hypothetical protein [Aliivibrio fischeri]|uniref:Uncharacterized protein n=1 Tax=Aliivibrio fischeri TaxID=668 RepID=A0A510URR2_ALIFS|nr:hypothetical protein [Aliivibrio fischeri]MUK51222.1 hypothetical protein [Aliivibrio fischeri]GEK15920.1 hypothetical protein AFI02nite_39560 [Aliivibrio fischeri]
MLRLLGVLCFYLLSISVLANVIEKPFYPKVRIIKNSPSDTIEIKINQSDFVTQYSASLGSFLPFNISFTVFSIMGTALDYRIKLQDSQHYCRDDGQVDTALIGVIKTTLDGRVFSPVNSGLPGSEGVPVFNSIESEHIMRVSFTSFPKKDVAQVCYGTFILIAEVTSV